MSEEIEVTLPKLGESIMNATIVQWFKKEGDLIGKDEPLLEVATDKVNSEIPSPVSGVIQKIAAQVDQELSVGDLLALIRTNESQAQITSEKRQETVEKPPSSSEMQDYYSPAILRIARENKISFEELQKVPGTGVGGRISKKDLERYIQKRKEPCPLRSPSAPKAGEIEHIKMTGMRKAIADNLVRSFYEAPHATLVSEVDVTDVMKRVNEEKEAFLKEHGAKLTITAFVARAITKALGEYPLLNASLEEDTIVVKRFVNLGIAVSVDQGILVPVVKGCQGLTLAQIALAIGDLAKKARGGRLSPDDVKEGTVTMTNFGMTGVLIGVPIIRYPEVAIVGIGGISKRVVALDDDLFGIRQMVHISLTFDHRVIDGIYGCEFLSSVKKHLEQPED